MAYNARITLFETPGVVLRRRSDQALLGEVLTNYPKHPQLMVAAVLRESLDADIALVDMKATEPARLQKIGEVPYGDETLEKLMVGCSFDSVTGQIRESDVIGITANFTYESGVIQRFMQHAKQVNPDVEIAVGGSDATARPETYLRLGADAVMLGKAEINGPHAIAAMLRGESLQEVSAIGYKDLISGAIKLNPRNKTLRAKVENLPLPALDLGSKYTWTQAAEGGLPEGVSPRVGVLETSRGCDEACSFCATTFQIGLHDYMPLERIIKNLDHLENNGLKTVIFIDDNILYRAKRNYGGNQGRDELIQLFNHMFNRGFSWTFYNGIQFSLLEENGQVDTELIDAMFCNNNVAREGGEPYGGAFRAYIPLERLTEQTRLRFKKLKPFDVQNRIIWEIAGRTPAMLNMGFVIGYPADTAATLREMEERAYELKDLVSSASRGLTRTNFIPFCLIPIPGTPDYRTVVREKRFAYDMNEHPELMNGYASILQGDYLSPNEITNWRMSLVSRLNADK